MNLNAYGVNANIRAHILSDDTMREIGFSNYDAMYWYFFKRLRDEISFNLTIPVDGSDIRIGILDEAFCQPCDYQHILEGHPNHEFALAVQGEVEKWMKYLADKGVLTGHEEGDYI